jgi:hypothetical protein
MWPPWATITPWRRTTDLELGGDRVRLVLDVDGRVLDRRRMPEKRSCVLPCTTCGRPAMSEFVRSALRSSSGKTLYFDASEIEQTLHLSDLLRHFRGEVVSLRPVLRRVVEFPDVSLSGGCAPTTTHGRFP